jgi:molecular chaperone GrpE
MTEQNPHDIGPGGRVDPTVPAVDSGQAHEPNLDLVDAPAAGAPAAPADDLQSLALALETSKAKASENYDLYVRSVAEMENIRRRSADDVSKAHKYAIESFAEAMVPVRDSLEMALKVEKPTVASLLEGVEATLRQLAAAFDRNRLIELNPVGEKFDPNKHQAISMVPGASVKPPVPANHVVAVLQKGYLINDRILRPALVTVAQG